MICFNIITIYLIFPLHAILVNYEDGSRSGQKIPPHEQVLEEGGWGLYHFIIKYIVLLTHNYIP